MKKLFSCIDKSRRRNLKSFAIDDRIAPIRCPKVRITCDNP